MRSWNLFSGVAVAAAILLTGAAAEAQKSTPEANKIPTDFKIRNELKTGCPNGTWGTAPDGTTCLPPGLTRLGGALPPGRVDKGPPPGWRPVSP
jgi:hypothetical protein